MDAYAYLIKHGWSGPGNPLNPDRASTRGGLGLTKPILVSRRSGNSGIGKTTTKDPTNQWWLRGFEDALKGMGTDAGKGAGDNGASRGNALTSELYRFFVRGEVVPGTLGNKDGNKKVEGGKEVLGKRKREDGGKESKEEKRVRREEKRRRKEEKVKRKAEKEERRRLRAEKREVKAKRAEEKAEKKKLKAEEKEKKTEKEKKKKPEEDYPTPVSMDLDSTDAQDNGSSLDTVKVKKAKKDKKEKKSKDDKTSEAEKSSSDEPSKRKSKKNKSTQ
ncbi:hypothetical protein BDV06DRAFT_230982 [Aspergillus oleicola]